MSWGITVMGYHSEGTGQARCHHSEGTVRAQGRAGVMGYHSEGTGQGRCHGVSQ